MKENETLGGERGKELIKMLKALEERGFYIVFITGNDFDLQYQRVLSPIIGSNLAESVLCFSDGGSRAFEFNKETSKFEEISAYSKENLISEKQKEWILAEFDRSLREFIVSHDSLNRPTIRLYDRTLKYLDLIIRPIRPSFYRSKSFKSFCDEIEHFSQMPEIKSTFQLIEDIPNALVVRAIGKNPESDVIDLQGMISNLFFKPQYADISKPETEVRGGKVISQIALKPFNDKDCRQEFREIMEKKLNKDGDAKFSVLLGGRSTIDIQLKDVNKPKAIRYLIAAKKLDPKGMIYFGDEFVPFGNDLPVAEMPDTERPAFIVHVGNASASKMVVNKEALNKIVIDGNGPIGTMNYLTFLLNEIPMV